MSRLVATTVLGSLLLSLPASADRRRRVAQKEDAEEEVDQDGPEAKSALTVKLDDLIEVAVRLSPELARSKNDRLTAKGAAQAARKDQQWVVSAKGEAERFATSPDVEVGAFQVVSENKLSVNLGVGRNIPTGGNVSFEVGIIRTLREFEIPAGLGRLMGEGIAANIPENLLDGDRVVDENIVNQAQAKLTFKQPLVRGFGSDVALANERKGDLAATDATVKTQFAAEEMVRDVATAYWELAYASYEVDTRAEALDIAKKQEEATRVEFRAQVGSQNALNAIQYEVAIREEALLDSKNTYEKKSLDLRKKVGLELDRRDIVLKPADKFLAEDDEWDVEEILKRSRKGNRQLASIILQKRQADIDVKVAKDAMLPQVDLQLSGALIGSGNTPDAAFSSTTGGAGFQVIAGLSVQFEVGGAAKGNHDAALARRQRLEVDQLDVQRSIDAEVVHAVHQAQSARARVTLAEKAILVAEDNWKGEKAAFQAGGNRTDNYKVMQRQTEVITAKIRRGRAIADYHNAVVQVQFFGGMLLEQYRVNVRPLPKK
ncbi:MAG: TolC family protein [Kofleriaceae bacterium]